MRAADDWSSCFVFPDWESKNAFMNSCHIFDSTFLIEGEEVVVPEDDFAVVLGAGDNIDTVTAFVGQRDEVVVGVVVEPEHSFFVLVHFGQGILSNCPQRIFEGSKRSFLRIDRSVLWEAGFVESDGGKHDGWCFIGDESTSETDAVGV